MFQLSDSIRSSILFAMEDQTVDYCFDCEKNCVVALDSVKQEDDIISLPEWTSQDGYNLLEQFTDGLHSPIARLDLQRSLSGGRGVFRNFKNALKQYPEVEKKFNYFKEKTMNKKINQWYNELRESWGLEKLSEEDDFSLETEDLVLNDFEFKVYDSLSDGEHIAYGEQLLTEEIQKLYAGELGNAVSYLTGLYSNEKNKYGIVCYSQTEDFIGCILFTNCPLEAKTEAKKTAVITDFFVMQNYRGLGIGKQLISKCLTQIKSAGIQWVIITNILLPEPIQNLLLQFGFEKLGTGFVVNLQLVKGDF